MLADEQSWHLALKTEADLAGLPDSLRAAAASAAERLGLPGQHAITLGRSSVEPFLQFVSLRFKHRDEMEEFVFDVAGCRNGVGNLVA